MIHCSTGRVRTQVKDDLLKGPNCPNPFVGSQVSCADLIIFFLNGNSKKQKHEFYEEFPRDKSVHKVNFLCFIGY